MPDFPETSKNRDFHTGKWDWLARSPAETTAVKLPLVGGKLQEKIGTVIAAHEDPLYGMSEGAKNSQESQGNWQAQAVIDREQIRITDRLKSANPQTRSEAANEAFELRSAVREGGTTLNRYIESKGDQIELSFEDARRKAEQKPKESAGQTAAYELIVEEAESVKEELSGEHVPDKAGKLQKLAGMASMLEGISGENPKGIKRLRIWLEQQATEIDHVLSQKQQELGLDKDLQEIRVQLQTSSQEKPGDQPVNVGRDQNSEVISVDLARQIQSAIESGDESLLPPDTGNRNDITARTKDLIKFNKENTAKKKKIGEAQTWTASQSQ
jgi:hypothetical protein